MKHPNTKYNKHKSQTATEYLIILTVVIIIALVVVNTMGGFPGIGAGTNKKVSDMKLSTDTIGIESYSIELTGSLFKLKNNNYDTITVTEFRVNQDENLTCNSSNTNPSLPIVLAIGESKIINCSAVNSSNYVITNKQTPLIGITYVDSMGAIRTAGNEGSSVATSNSQEQVAPPVTSVYTVTFNSDGGSTVSSITNISNGATITLPSNPSKSGNIFSGWFTQINGAGTQFTSETIVIADVTVYAKWDICNDEAEFHNGAGTVNSPYGICNWDHLDNVRDHLGSYFILLDDLGSNTYGYNAGWNGPGHLWVPIGDCGGDYDNVWGNDCWDGDENQFSGNFNGNGHIISLYIDNLFVGRNNYLGMFGYSTGSISNLGLTVDFVGAANSVGGLVGLLGYEGCNGDCGSITNSYSTGSISGNSDVGGLVGRSYGSIINSYSSVSIVSSGWEVGGLAGRNYGSINNSYSTGSISGNGGDFAGITGWNFGSINNSYSTVNVSGNGLVGGLVAENSGSISNSYSTGSVSNGIPAGGLVSSNENTGVISNSFFDKETSGQTSMCGTAGGTGCDDSYGKTTSEMKTQSTFTDASWDFDNIWNINNGVSYPYLR